MEHIFDIKSVMSNIVRVTNINGYVLQFIPAQNFLNHGFYQISPTLFYDFYTVNGFEIIESYIIEDLGNGVTRFHEYNQSKDYIRLFFNPSNRLSNCFLVKKIFDPKEIISPTQYFYSQLYLDPKEVNMDFNHSLFDRIVTKLRKIIPIRYHGRFFKLWCFLKRISNRSNFFDIKN